MKTILRYFPPVLILLWALAGCSAVSPRPAPTLLNVTSAPLPTQVRALPTAMPGGQAVEYNGLRVSMHQAEITAGYVTEFGSRREPTKGLRFLWVNIQIENISPVDKNLPDIKHFSAIYDKTELKPAYGHRKDHLDYTSLQPSLSPSQKVDAWLRFDVPGTLELNDLRFVYLPDSLRVSFEFPTSGYSWADHPEFFWLTQQ